MRIRRICQMSVETTPAPTQDKELTEPIHRRLADKQLLPREHLADTGYVDGPQLVTSQQEYGIDLLGPVTVDPRGPGQSRTRL